MIEKMLDAITRRVRKTLESGLSIAVVGWRDSNHSQFTRQLSAGEKVMFLDASARSLPEKVGFVLFTRFVSHAEFKRLKKGKPHNAVPIDPGQIKKILESCEDLLAFPPVPVAGIVPEPLSAEPSARTASVAQTEDKVLDFAINIMEEHKMSDMDHFVAAFLKAATESRNGLVGSRTLGALRVRYNINLTAPQLEKEHWTESITQPGKMKIGWYKAGSKMSEASRQERFEPQDPIERAKFYIAQEPVFLAQQAELKARLAEVEKKLEKVSFLKQNFDQITKTVEELK